MKVILASGSPRRKQILSELLDMFETVNPRCDEICTADSPQQYVMELAQRKAHSVAQDNPTSVVIGCDTIVVKDNKVLLKPKTAQQAYDTLRSLSGSTHTVYTGIAIVSANADICYCEHTDVTFRALTDKDINDYIATGNCFDKAGAYGIQETDFVSQLDGEYNCVVGLPLTKLSQHLQQLGVFVKPQKVVK